MSGKQTKILTDFFKEDSEEKSPLSPESPTTPNARLPRRRQRLTEEEAEIIHLMRGIGIKPKINVDLPYREASIMTPRNKR